MNFSVLMSVYIKETSENLAECLDSLCRQSVKPNQVVLVEDGPISDSLHEIIEEYRQTLNIHSVTLEENQGLAKALNEGLKFCEYDLVARMDSDDISLPSRFEKQLDFMEQNPNIDASSGYIDEFDASGKVVSTRKLPILPGDVKIFAKKRSPLSHPATIFRKQAVLSVGGYPELYPEDYLLWVKMIINGSNLANIPEVLLKMRTDQAFITRRGYEFLKGEIKIYQYMRAEGFISYFEYCKIILIRSALRLSPNFLKVMFYKFAR
ncbi:glycosyltransferase [Bermanella marisrubri]|uniref:Putative glycosyltransferase n=1 Tax=Bermanella marisrubri TaxID=207949 RepID=Q1N5A4_9GAMM|nr:glycosyltransferase [Bermanella marisrubri]EAT13144.1 putative glycosyltransferase [Oceanobacter sp. RED65] [Bermanella marisrubri]QIZ83920.1 glycosyltransferase [Bermanella marisrubri]